MKFGGICIETNNAPRLAEFYKIVLQEEPLVELPDSLHSSR
jgi:hypothetical protein